MKGASPRSILDIIGGRYAVTPLALLLIFFPSILPNVVYDRALHGGSIADWAMVGMVGSLLGGMAYLGLGAIFLPRRPRASRPFAALTVFGIAGLVRGVTIAWLSFTMGLTPDPQWVFRTIGATALGIAWFSLAAVVTDAWSGHREVVRDLEARRRRAVSMRKEATAELEATQKEIRATVLGQVTAILALLGQAMRKGTDARGARNVADRLHIAVQEVVRPLSHSLAASGRGLAGRGDARESFGQRTQAWYRSILGDALTVDPYHPAFTAIIIVPSCLTAAIRDFGPVAGPLGAVLIGAFAWFGLDVARRVSAARRRRVGHWSWLPAIAVYAVVGILCSLVPMTAALVLNQDGWVAWRSAGQSLVILVPLAAFGAAFFAAEDHRRAMSELEREAEVAHEEWLTQRVQQELWAANHRLARQLHGKVQSQLTAAALRLEAWARDPEPAALPPVLDEVTTALREVTHLLEEQGSVRPTDLEDAVTAMTSVWNGVADTDLTFDADTVALLSTDPAACESVIEIVRECVGNAIRHGRAQHLWIDVKAADAVTVLVVVDDDGHGLPQPTVSGLGSQLLDQVCLSWERTPQSRGTRVTARVPVSPDNLDAMRSWETQSA